jgi:hypothetical protein
MHLFPDFAMMQHVHLPMIAMIPGGPECQMTATVVSVFTELTLGILKGNWKSI